MHEMGTKGVVVWLSIGVALFIWAMVCPMSAFGREGDIIALAPIALWVLTTLRGLYD